MENNEIKKEVDDFEKALIDRDRLQIFNVPLMSKEEVQAVKMGLGLDAKLKGTDIDKALRYNDGKLQWSMVDFDSLEGLVRVLEYGAKKYSKNNCRDVWFTKNNSRTK